MSDGNQGSDRDCLRSWRSAPLPLPHNPENPGAARTWSLGSTRNGLWWSWTTAESNLGWSSSSSLLRWDIVFVGVHVKEDVRKLKENFGVEVRNVVELSELAANALRKPRLVAYGPRELAREVLKVGLDQRPQNVMWMGWTAEFLTAEQIECATIDAYVTYKTGKKLLSSN
ncbi:hypothetical protein M0R45_002836 [Rubus argutus]|uniref:3'-5' exonuclease domain-containing protein n=1 Tax=Rubus argutus TaxID=59490 RepID=A0AAW1VQQ6_RUBAR